MSYYMNMTLNEKSLDDYASEKQKRINDERSRDADRYGHDNSYRDLAGSGSVTGGSRTKIYAGNIGKRDFKDDAQADTSHVDRNPKYDSARKFNKMKDKYPDVIPSNSKKQRELEDAKRKEHDELDYAHNVSKQYVKTNDIYKANTQDYNRAVDAAARHYRRHLAKNEAGIFSECNFIEFAY